MGVIKRFKPGQLICNWHKRSYWNTKGYHLYKVYKPVIQPFEDVTAAA